VTYITQADKTKLFEELKELEFAGDPESTHMRADEILCEILMDHGDEDFVAAFKRVEKWYA
jgi:hypothetical protein